MEKLRIMSFDLDSFSLVKSKEERCKRVIDYIKNIDIDFALLQGNKHLLYNVLCNSEDYLVEYFYKNNMFLKHARTEYIDDYMGENTGVYVSRIDNQDIALYNVKKYRKESLWEFRNMLKEFENVEHKVVAGTLPSVNIESFCNKYNLDNVCSGPRSNHILVSKELDARVVDRPVMVSVDAQPMVVDITYKKVR